ncbi:MAG: VIT1/CCC1 transporter family protein [Flavobacteriales bacterium]|nr:VIT1/CCC1 transporter family protein [Flavobacteriales bacterium]
MNLAREHRRWLDPVERSLEALFGLIMVLTFTGSLSVMSAGRQDVREMLIGALGCNLAWGVIDACFYLMGILTARGHGILLIHRLRKTKDDKEVAGIYAETMPEVVVDLLTPSERESLRQRIAALPDPKRRAWLTMDDLKGAVGVFLWVFIITFPVVLPFFFMTDAVMALRMSNGIAIALLGLVGHRLATYAGWRKVRTILFMVVFGCATVALTISLGG